MVIAFIYRQKDFHGAALAYGDRHGGSDLTQQGIGGHNAQRADDIIGIPAVDQHRIFPGGAVIGPGL